MTDIKALATFQVSIGGVPFVGRRRHTALMLQIGNPETVFGLLAKVKEAKAEEQDKVLNAYAEATADMEAKALKYALLTVGGKTVEELGLDIEDLSHVGHAFLMSFISSGLKADPMPRSCKGRQDQEQQEP